MQTCETCRFWNDKRPHSYEGVCRRNAPVCLSDGSREWPDTKAADWCGEHQPKAHAMTPERERLMQAVVEAAEGWQRTVLDVFPRTDEECEAYEAFDTALFALRAHDAAHPPGQVGETVEIAVWRHADGAVLFAISGSMDDATAGTYSNRLGTVALPIRATMEPGA